MGRHFGSVAGPRGRFWRSLAFCTAAPILLVVLLSGAGLYGVVRRSVERYAVTQVERELEIDARDLYSLCEQSYGQLLRTGALGNPRQEAVLRGRTLGSIEDFLRQRSLAGRVTAGGEAVLEVGSRDALAAAAADREGATLRTFGGRRYVAARIPYDPWQWQVTLLRDLSESAALVGEVRKTYVVAGLWLVGTAALLGLLLGQLFRRPVRAILGPLAAGERPTYRGIAEFEHLSKTVGQIVESEREKSARLAEAQRLAHLGNWLWDLKTRAVTWSAELSRVLGLEESFSTTDPEALERSVHPDDRGRLREALVAALRGTAPFALELRIVRPDGEVRVLEARAEVTRGADGRAVRLTDTAHDVTERKGVEVALRDGEARFRALAEHSQAGIWQLGPDDRTLYVNPAMCRILEVAGLADVHGLPFDGFFTPESVARMTADAPARARGESTNYEVEIVGRQGGRRVAMLSAASVPGEGGRGRGTMGTFVETTALRAAEAERHALQEQVRQKQKLESLGVLAGGIAHDLNNTLVPIIGFTEMVAEDTPEQSPSRDRLDQVLRAASRARDLVAQILAFAREGDDETHCLELADEVRNAMDLVRATLPATIRVETSVVDEGAWVRATPTAIHQVLTNLCINAGQAMAAEGGLLEVSQESVLLAEGPELGPDLEPGEYVCLTVRDTGCGMEPEVLDRIFEPFFTTKGVGQGTGMGLSVVHGIVREFGGAVRVRSTPGQGTTFRVFLPCAAPECEEAVEEPQPPALPGSGRLLLVDDEEMLLSFLSQTLERSGYRTRAFTSPTEALAWFRGDPEGIDLVVTDQTMPEMTGDALVRELLGVRPSLPVLLCSGFNSTVDAEKARALGARAFLSKPFGPAALLAAVRSTLAEQG